MGKETCQRSRYDALIWSKWRAFSSLISFLGILIFLFFGISTVNVQSGSSPRTKQLSDRNAVESRTTTVLTSFRRIEFDSKEKIVATYLAPWLDNINHPRHW